MRRETRPDPQPDEPAPDRPIDQQRYADIVSAVRQVRECGTASDPAASSEASPVLFLEARLLDNRRYRQWLELLAPDYAYWIPHSADLDDPRAESGVNFDDRRRMIDRIALIETGSLHAQIPPSRATRIITNIEAWRDGADRLLVRSNLLIKEFRRSTITTFIGAQVHELAMSNGALVIRTRVLHLLDCDEPQGNVTFIL
ncbi:MAG: aromatic-ring-hydroxylating dioxygenase subunit beta [Dongiaceae bacterium]